MKTPLVMLVDDEVPFVETMVKRLEKRNLKVIAHGASGRDPVFHHYASVLLKLNGRKLH